MNQWLNRSHPQTLQAGVILGYISAVFGMLRLAANPLLLVIYIGLFGGAFATANNKRWGYILLAVCAFLAAFLEVLPLVFALLDPDIVTILIAMTNTLFPVALAVAVVHVQSREYQKIWFE